mgnify:CR=1 FL=1
MPKASSAQGGVKALFSDEALREVLREKGWFLSSANSINWGRILPQIVYYISAYCDLQASRSSPSLLRLSEMSWGSICSAKSLNAQVGPCHSSGGLFAPEAFPDLGTLDLKVLGAMSYQQRASFIMGKYLEASPLPGRGPRWSGT